MNLIPDTYEDIVYETRRIERHPVFKSYSKKAGAAILSEVYNKHVPDGYFFVI